MLLGSPEKTVQGQDGQHASEKPSEANKCPLDLTVDKSNFGGVVGA